MRVYMYAKCICLGDVHVCVCVCARACACVRVCMCSCVQVVLYCDLHGHSRRHNVFMYGNNTSSEDDTTAEGGARSFVSERLFPWLMASTVSGRRRWEGEGGRKRGRDERGGKRDR